MSYTNMSGPRDTFLLFDNYVKEGSMALFRELYAARGDNLRLVGNRTMLRLTLQGIAGIKIFDFEEESAHPEPLTGGFSPWTGANDLRVLKYYETNSDSDYYWGVQANTRITGEFSEFAKCCAESNADLLCPELSTWNKAHPDWHTWVDCERNGFMVPAEERIHGRFPLFRLSNRALQVLKDQRNGWIGHFEIVLPTLLAAEGLRIQTFTDIGFEAPKPGSAAGERIRHCGNFSEIDHSSQAVWYPAPLTGPGFPEQVRIIPSLLEAKGLTASTTWQRRADLSIEPVENGYLAKWDNARQKLELNQTVAVVLDACQHEGLTVAELVSLVVDQFPDSQFPVETVVARVLNNFSAHGLIRFQATH